MLVVESKIGFGNFIRVEHLVRSVILSVTAVVGLDPAINDKMADMNILWMKLARQ